MRQTKRAGVTLGALLAVGAVAVALACSGGDTKATPSRDAAVADAPDSGTKTSSVKTNPATGTTPPADGRRAVLFLGTSLTAGLGLEPDSAFPQQIQRKIEASGLSYRTVNAGVSGETSAGLLRRLDWVLQSPAAVILVETGANDVLRGQSVNATKATIGKILFH